MNQRISVESLGQTVSEQLYELTRRPLDRRTLDRAVLHLIDWMGCAIAGRATEAGRIFLGGPASPSAGLPPDALAFRYGSLGSILEMDDVHRAALLHPGPVVIPAVIASASDDQGTEVLEAIVAGYEAMIRLGRSVGPSHYARFHNTGTCGGVGSAIASARLLGLREEQTVWAVGNSVTLSSGLWQCRNEPVLTKPLHVAEAARRGVQAAVLAQRGFSGPARIFEGPQGFFPALAPDGSPDRMLAALTSDWLIFETSFKPWPACRHAHATIDAALTIRQALAGREIRCIEIETFGDALKFCDRPEPKTSGEAKFSLQHSAAVVLAKGRPELEDFEVEALGDSRFSDLRQKTRVTATDSFTLRYPAHFGAAMKVMLSDGTILSAQVDDAFGDSENPMSEADITEKFHRLCGWAGLSSEARAELLGRARDLVMGGRIEPLKRALASHI